MTTPPNPTLPDNASESYAVRSEKP